MHLMPDVANTGTSIHYYLMYAQKLSNSTVCSINLIPHKHLYLLSSVDLMKHFLLQNSTNCDTGTGFTHTPVVLWSM